MESTENTSNSFRSEVIYARRPTHPELACIRKTLSNAKILALFEKGPIRPKALVAKLHPTPIGIRLDVIKKRLVDAAHLCELEMFIYTVNESEDG